MLKVQETATQLVVSGPEHQLTAMVEAFRFHPPGYFYAVSYQRYMKSDGEEGWDGWLYPFRKVKGYGVLPRGRKEDLFRLAYEEGIKVDPAGLLDNPFTALEIDDVRPDLIAGSYELDIRQRTCILNWLRAGIGINKVTVGGGKTNTFGGAAALIKERFSDARFLYITPSERLVRQSTREMRRMLPHFEVGQCGGGQHEFEARDMVVCTVAMLNAHFDGLLHEGFFETFICILFDESHHAASATAKKILNAVPAFFRLGASDSTKEKDLAKHYAIRGLLGPVLTEVKAHPLIKIGRLAQPHIYIVDLKEYRGKFNHIEHRALPNSDAYALLDGVWRKGTYLGPVYELDDKGEIKMRLVKTAEVLEMTDPETGRVTQSFKVEQKPIIVDGVHRLKIDGEEYEVESRWCLLDRVYDRAIIRFKSRNDLIVKWTDYFHRRGWPTVVVATRTTHVYILEALLKKVIPKEMVRILTGYEKDSPEQRDAMFEWFKQTPGAVLISPLIKEGISINELRAMVVADHISDPEVMRQIFGRAMRPKGADNRAHVAVFWDRQNTVLSRGCHKLLNELEQTDGFSYYHPVHDPDDVFEVKQGELPLGPGSKEA